MLKEKDFDTADTTAGTAGTAGTVADFAGQCIASNASFYMIESTEKHEPDKGAGFVFVGNDTWLPKSLVNARERQRRKLSRGAEKGIVWTR